MRLIKNLVVIVTAAMSLSPLVVSADPNNNTKNNASSELNIQLGPRPFFWSTICKRVI